jgi:hypothetical protein
MSGLSYPRTGRGAMLQIYFLSIACNLIGGMTLAADSIVKRIPNLQPLAVLLSNRGAKLWTGLSVIIVGFIQLFVPAGGALIIGDLIPAGVGMLMGIALLFEVFRQDAIFPSEASSKPERPSPVAYRTTLGLLGLVVAVLHFFLPDRYFL